MLIPTHAWAALLESGVTVRPTGPAQVELVAAEGDAVAVTAVVERRLTALSPSHVRSHLLHGSPARGELLLVVPSASRAALDAAAAAGISVLVADPTVPSAVTGRIVLPDRTIELGADLPRPDAGQSPSRPGRRPWGALTVVRRLLTAGPATQVDLGRSAAVSQARVSQALSGLVADGLVRRTADAGRPRWAPADWDALVDWWLAHYPGPGGITTYWYGLAGVSEQARAAVAALSAAGMPAAVSGDVAADVLAPWRRPGRAIVYADPSGRPVHDELTAAGLTPSGAGEATLELIVPADPGVWPAPGTTAAEADLPLADPLQLLWDVVRAPGADVDQAVAALRPVLKARAAAAASR
jgi:hypothetical protein